jgi:hypothetical protein
MSLQSFISEVRKGMSRTNRYEVIIPFPNTDRNGSRLASLFCEATNLPGMNIATTPARVFGEMRQMPYERMFDPVNLSFYIDSNMEVKAAFERWIQLIFNQTNRSIGYYDEYIRDVQIIVKNVDDSISSILTLYEAFPKSIQTIQLSAESREVMKMQVQLEYKYWTSSLSRGVNSSPQNYTTSLGRLQDRSGVNTSTGYPLTNPASAILPNE